MIKDSIIAALLMIFTITAASAHEYYLMPESFTPDSNTEFSVRHRLGQNFKGNELPFINSWNIRSEIWKDGKKRLVRGLDGDRPALKVSHAGAGLMSVVHQSNVDFLTFTSWDKFKSYVVNNGLEHALEASQTGSKPKEGLKEGYSRFAKTLVALNGAKDGSDRATGLKIELVALAHPLSLSESEPMPVLLLFDGQPLAGAQIKVFNKIGNDFAHQIRTDAEGKAMIPAEGQGPYLLNAIHMTEPQSDKAIEKGAHWESFWATLTYQRAK